ncbi:aspartate aminotransferase family protein [Idiomarina sp. HP20-50]|uniref:pyridoxal phosphate-dependent decarboxylase family protein n=1 Tax=Idiomarina sp. HP20-50 TaxID=3070813 RepID=UPI00294AB0B4|nr:aspartate aminotransferase family protein [Idiomarina sp. HP20-50]MDV6315720.1 aspartate aminotransferase family protein [Idiomarina sp. HP20-50]
MARTSIESERASNDPGYGTAGHLQFAPHTELFGIAPEHHYTRLMQLGMETLKNRLEQLDGPSSGIRPEELQKAFSNIDLDHPLENIEQVLAEIDTLYLSHAIYFQHPDYLAHLNCPVMLTSLLAEQLTSAINTAVETWDQSAGGTLIEQKVIDWVCQRVGFQEFADGVFTTGGTQSNLMALLLARELAGSREPGHRGNVLAGLSPNARHYRILCSEFSHFSIQKAASLLGLGHEAVVSIGCDSNRRMDPKILASKLRQLKAAGLITIAVVATAGTTDFGAIDPISPIAALCQEFDCYLHVDAAYGGALLLSPTQRQRLEGIELADSVSLDFHKSFFQPVCCSALLVKDKGMLGYLTYHADYLNPKCQAQAGVPNLVNKSLQTTRRFDALKLWLSLRAAGPDAIGEMFDNLIATTAALYERFWRFPELQAAQRPSLTTLVFRFNDPTLDSTQLDQCNRHIRGRLAREGRAMIAATKVAGSQYLKFTLLNPHTRLEKIEAVLTDISKIGREQARYYKTGAPSSA